MLVAELLLALDRVGADADALGADRGELAGEVAEVAALLGAPAGQCLRVEEQDDRPLASSVGELARVAVLVGQLEVGYNVAYFDASSSRTVVASTSGRARST